MMTTPSDQYVQYFILYQIWLIVAPWVFGLIELTRSILKQRYIISFQVSSAIPVEYAAVVNAIVKIYPNISRVHKEQPTITPGQYVIWYKNWPLVISATRVDQTSYTSEVARVEISGILWVSDFRKQAISAHIVKKQVYTPQVSQSHVSWMPGRYISARNFDSIACIADMEIRKTFEQFYKPHPTIIRLNIPRTLCILLSGPPGFGKTSIIRAIASEYSLNIYQVNTAILNDSNIETMRLCGGSGGIYVLEDADCMNAQDATTSTGVSLSGLLNFLDGVNTPDGQIVILTTNFPEKLDPALVRSERVHKHIHVGPNAAGYNRMYELFYEEVPPITFTEICMGITPSFADLQLHFKKYLDDPIEMLKNIANMPRSTFVKPKPQAAAPNEPSGLFAYREWPETDLEPV